MARPLQTSRWPRLSLAPTQLPEQAQGSPNATGSASAIPVTVVVARAVAVVEEVVELARTAGSPGVGFTRARAGITGVCPRAGWSRRAVPGSHPFSLPAVPVAACGIARATTRGAARAATGRRQHRHLNRFRRSPPPRSYRPHRSHPPDRRQSRPTHRQHPAPRPALSAEPSLFGLSAVQVRARRSPRPTVTATPTSPNSAHEVRFTIHDPGRMHQQVHVAESAPDHRLKHPHSRTS
jgi:hypothetical protein